MSSGVLVEGEERRGEGSAKDKIVLIVFVLLWNFNGSGENNSFTKRMKMLNIKLKSPFKCLVFHDSPVLIIRIPDTQMHQCSLK